MEGDLEVARRGGWGTGDRHHQHWPHTCRQLCRGGGPVQLRMEGPCSKQQGGRGVHEGFGAC